MHDVITFSIEHAVSSGSIDDIACAVRSHPCVLLIPHELLEDTNHSSFWDCVRFLANCEKSSSAGSAAHG